MACGGLLFHAVGSRGVKENSVVEAGLMVIRPASTCLAHRDKFFRTGGMRRGNTVVEAGLIVTGQLQTCLSHGHKLFRAGRMNGHAVVEVGLGGSHLHGDAEALLSLIHI